MKFLKQLNNCFKSQDVKNSVIFLKKFLTFVAIHGIIVSRYKESDKDGEK